MNFIRNIVEPDRLLLSWQLPKDEPDRQRMMVAEIHRTKDSANLTYLIDTEEFNQAKEKGFKEYPGYPVKNASYGNVLSAFVKRIPPRKRKDFPRFLESIRIQEDSNVSDFALLGYSNAILPGDNFTFIHTFENAEPPFEFLTQIQGYRYHMDGVLYESLDKGIKVDFQKEPDNQYDSKAISVLFDGKRSGYICRGLIDSFHKWIDRGFQISANIEKINGTAEYPIVYIFVNVTNQL